MADDRPPSRIRDRREELNMRLADVSQITSISVSYLSMIENGLHCRAILRKDIARALRCKTEDLWP